MRVGVRRPDLRAHREERPIDELVDIARLERFGEARPARAGVELVERAKQRLTGHDIHIDPRLVVVPVLVVERRLGGRVLGHLILPRCERAAQVGVARLPELHRIPSFRAALGARAAGQGREREREHQGATHVVAYFTVNRTVSTTSGFRGTCYQSATTAITRWGPGVRESSTNSVCPRPRCRIPVTPRGIVSLSGVRSWFTNR